MKMATKGEALKLAIEAWDNIDTTNQSNVECARNWFIEGYVQALEQPAQDYVFICKRCGDDLGIEYVPDEQPAQEPVGVVSWHEGAVMGSIFPSSNMPKDGDKLYTHPHQWQGLTDDEYKQIVEVGFKLGYEACKCEQTLKEKNHG